jgi:hypothetical protein
MTPGGALVGVLLLAGLAAHAQPHPARAANLRPDRVPLARSRATVRGLPRRRPAHGKRQPPTTGRDAYYPTLAPNVLSILSAAGCRAIGSW